MPYPPNQKLPGRHTTPDLDTRIFIMFTQSPQPSRLDSPPNLAHQAPLGSPVINPDEMSSSSDSEPETPRPIPQRNRRMSSIMRAERAALSLSKPAPPSTATTRGRTTDADKRESRVVGFTRIAASADKFGKLSWRRYLASAPVYPGGVGGRFVCSGPQGAMFMSATKTTKTFYKMVFIEKAGEPELLEANTPEGSKTSRKVTPLIGLEAVREGGEEVLCIRAVGDVTTGNNIIARIIQARQPGTGGSGAAACEEIYSVVLKGGTDEAAEQGGAGGGEVMAVRVSTHPTRLAAPRQVHAILMLPDGGSSEGRKEEKER